MVQGHILSIHPSIAATGWLCRGRCLFCQLPKWEEVRLVFYGVSLLYPQCPSRSKHCPICSECLRSSAWTERETTAIWKQARPRSPRPPLWTTRGPSAETRRICPSSSPTSSWCARWPRSRSTWAGTSLWCWSPHCPRYASWSASGSESLRWSSARKPTRSSCSKPSWSRRRKTGGGLTPAAWTLGKQSINGPEETRRPTRRKPNPGRPWWRRRHQRDLRLSDEG